MKLPYVEGATEFSSPEDAAIYERIQGRRGGTLLPLDKALLHSPAFADGWNSLLGAVRQRGVLSDDLREISICRVALQNRAWFEWDQHAPLLQAAEGVTDECMDVIKAPTPTTRGPLSEKQWLVLQYSDAMTRQIEVHENLFRRLREVFNDREVVELTITCAAYNMVSRFLVALDVGELNGKPPFALE